MIWRFSLGERYYSHLLWFCIALHRLVNGLKKTVVTLAWFKRRILHAPNQIAELKGHGQLFGRADLDPSFLHFEKSPPQPEIKNTLRVHLKIRFNLPSVLLDFPSFTENLFLSALLVILCYYFIIFG